LRRPEIRWRYLHRAAELGFSPRPC
jgi:hypothetical protein